MGKSSELSDGVKIAIVRMHESGQDSTEIADILRLKSRTVRYVIQKFKERGTVAAQKRSGRPRKTDSRFDRCLKILSMKDCFKTAPKLGKEMALETGVEVSNRTIQRRLCDAGLNGCVAKKKPYISDKNRKKRLDFARQHQNWTSENWAEVLWTDESKCNMKASDGIVYVRRRVGEALNPKCLRGTVKHGGGGIMVWGSMSASGVGRLYGVQGTLRADQYLKILKYHMVPSMKDLFGHKQAVFQQDNDPKHTAKTTKSWLSKQPFRVLKWPPQSPDLNPIENLWEIVNQHRDKSRRIKNEDELWQECQETWHKISADICRNLVESMPRRLAEVIKHNGGSTKY